MMKLYTSMKEIKSITTVSQQQTKLDNDENIYINKSLIWIRVCYQHDKEVVQYKELVGYCNKPIVYKWDFNANISKLFTPSFVNMCS